MFQISAIALGDLGQPAGTPREDHQSDHQADAKAAQPVNVVLYLVADDGELGHRRVQQALLEAESRPSRTSSTVTTTSSRGNNAKKAL